MRGGGGAKGREGKMSLVSLSLVPVLRVTAGMPVSHRTEAKSPYTLSWRDGL